MPLRFQLLLLSLLTLFLPWAGCRYAREMETVLRDGEQQALLATATTLASVIDADADPSVSLPAAPPEFDPEGGDFYVYRLRARPLLDGYADDWGVSEERFKSVAAEGGALQVRYAAAMDEQNLYLLFIVGDTHVML
jgi:two-component system, OmpR family, sensor histidine kinase ChvG